MARPKKLTLDFFLHKSGFNEDRRMKLLRRKHGNDGYATYFCLLESICKESGMQLNLSDNDLCELLAEDFSLRDSRHLYAIIQSCTEVGLLDKQLWESERIAFSPDMFFDYQDRLEARKATADRMKRSRDAKSLQAKLDLLNGKDPIHSQENEVVTHNNPVVTHNNLVLTGNNGVVTQLLQDCDVPEYRRSEYRRSEDQKIRTQNTEHKDSARTGARVCVGEACLVDSSDGGDFLSGLECDAEPAEPAPHSSYPGSTEKEGKSSDTPVHFPVSSTSMKVGEIVETCNPSLSTVESAKAQKTSAYVPSEKYVQLRAEFHTKLDGSSSFVDGGITYGKAETELARWIYNTHKADAWTLEGARRGSMSDTNQKAYQAIKKAKKWSSDEMGDRILKTCLVTKRDTWWGSSDRTNLGLATILRKDKGNLESLSDRFDAEEFVKTSGANAEFMGNGLARRVQSDVEKIRAFMANRGAA